MATQLHHGTPHLLPNLTAPLARAGHSVMAFLTIFQTACQLAAEAEADGRVPEHALERMAAADKRASRH
ncbi:hypothetical protein [Afifella sp. IM 167]|uniref:hypothetical protein n=1 Tax=Afifella sp. IM 167 TaxID=2033586 RepID=UPI001CCE73FC|nr:hypothetical protein [Afifella sp. IM 167]MBZ8131976.1 hypothetical protein [Afifella sp. IM 167]